MKSNEYISAASKIQNEIKFYIVYMIYKGDISNDNTLVYRS